MVFQLLVFERVGAPGRFPWIFVGRGDTSYGFRDVPKIISLHLSFGENYNLRSPNIQTIGSLLF
jgi:hypothetical protein